MSDTHQRPLPSGVFPKLFSEFPCPTVEQWRSAVSDSLRGIPFDKAMTVERQDGITVAPLCTQAPKDVPRPVLPHGNHGANGWTLCQELREALPETFAEALTHDASRGLDAVVVAFDRASRAGLDPDQARPQDVGAGGLSISRLDDMKTALAGVKLGELPLHINAGASGLPTLAFLVSACEDAGQPVERLTGSLRCDPLGQLALRGMLPRSLNALYDEMATLITWSTESAPHLRTVGVSTLPYHDAGATEPEELALGIATAIEYTRQMISRGHLPELALSSVQLEVGIGSDFFAEVAKLRAARWLWAMVAESLGVTSADSILEIHARTSSYTTAAVDPHTNILRSTTQAFAAAIGGASSICTVPFDETSGSASPEPARRLARGVQLLLSRESRIGTVLDPAGGSYHLEQLTHAVASQAWELVRKIEAKGGMYQALEEGLVQSIVARSHQQRCEQLSTRKKVLVGVNMFSDSTSAVGLSCEDENNEERSENLASRCRTWRQDIAGGSRAELLELLAAVASHSGPDTVETVMEAARAGATLGQISRALAHGGEAVHVDPLVIERPALVFEALRRRAHAYASRQGHRPRVHLACVGPVAQYKARADFSRGFFEVAGFEVVSGEPVVNGQQAGEQAVSSGAEIAVLCSSDETYPELVPSFVDGLRLRETPAIAVLAGWPKAQIETHRGSGIDVFIHAKADIRALLGDLLARIGA